jgi:septal ring factor EnvC (AmiA/AmiB activator)
MRRFLVALVVLGLITATAVGQSRRQAEQRLDSLKVELEAQRQKLDRLGQSEGNVLGKLQELEETIDLNSTVVERLKTRESRVVKEISLADSMLSTRESLLAETRQHYQHRLVSVSRSMVQRPPDWLYLASDPGQAVLSAPLLRAISMADRWLIARYDSLRVDVEQSRSMLLDRRTELSSLRRDKQRETNLLAASHEKRESQLKQIRTERTYLASAMQELVDASQRLESLIEELVESGAASYGGDGRHVKRSKGRLPWPVRGKVLEGFGYREVGPKRAKVPHHGLSIASDVGSPVKSVADGAVTYTGRLRGYGQIVIVDHGGGYFTLYGHLSEVRCFKGQILLQGDVVGTVGESGSLTGPQLYFEFRENRIQVDPILWLGQ